MTLVVRDLAFGYSDRPVGRDVSFELKPGEALALLGPNGSGKTTLLKTILGLLAPHDGMILLDGKPLSRLSIAERARQIAYVPQTHAGTFAFTAFEMVLMGRTAHGGLLARPSPRDRAIATEMLERLGVGHLGHRSYTMISGGERQLVLVARALAQEPRIVVLDEPTASLDFGNQGNVMRQIRTLTMQGLGVLFTTHDPNQALRNADCVILIRDGCVQASGAVGDVITKPQLDTLYAATISELVEARSNRRAFFPE